MIKMTLNFVITVEILGKMYVACENDVLLVFLQSKAFNLRSKLKLKLRSLFSKRNSMKNSRTFAG